MKFMISCRHSLTQLAQCDEIKVDYKDIARLADFITDKWQCDKDVYIYIPANTEVDWRRLQTYQEVLSMYVAVEEPAMIEVAKNNGFKVFWSYPATSYWELRGLLALGVSQVILDAPLYFDLEKAKAACGEVEIRLVANKCFNGYMKRADGVCGTYIRPEDVDLYSRYVDHIEFDTDGDLRKEMALLRIYKQDKHWPGNLNILLTYLNVNVDNRGFDEKFGQHRMNCYQSCQRNGNCHYCRSVFTFITTSLKHKTDIAQQLEEVNNIEDDSEG